MPSSRQKLGAVSWGRDVSDMWLTLSTEACVSVRSWKSCALSAAQTRSQAPKGGP